MGGPTSCATLVPHAGTAEHSGLGLRSTEARAELGEVTWPKRPVEGLPCRAGRRHAFCCANGTGIALSLELAKTKLPDPLTKAESLARGLKFKVGEKVLRSRCQSEFWEQVPACNPYSPAGSPDSD